MLQAAITIHKPPIMSTQASHFLRLPAELRLMIYERVLDGPRESTILTHSLAYVSDQVSEEIMPILLRQFSGFFWTAIPCDEEWYLALQPRKKIWRLRLANVSELPLDTVPTLHTKVSFHLLVGRRVVTFDSLFNRLHLYGGLTIGCSFRLDKQDRQDGVKRLVSSKAHHRDDCDYSAIWFERGRAGAPGMNKTLTKRVWNQQWNGGGRRGPLTAWMCKFFSSQPCERG